MPPRRVKSWLPFDTFSHFSSLFFDWYSDDYWRTTGPRQAAPRRSRVAQPVPEGAARRGEGEAKQER